jgi:hypothetical protein
MARNTYAHDEDDLEDVDAVTGDEVEDELELDTDGWEDESTGGDPVDEPEPEPAPEPEKPARKGTTKGSPK